MTALAALAVLLCFALPAVLSEPAYASGTLQVVPTRLLSQVGEQSPLTIIVGDAAALYEGATVGVRLEGPATPEQVGRAEVRLPLVGESTVALSARPVDSTGSSGGEVPLPLLQWGEERLTSPGAYRVTVTLSARGEVMAAGSAWLGKVGPRDRPLELALVWPLVLGIHRTAEGVFFDRVLEEALRSSPAGMDGLLGLRERFPTWRFTLAIEPVLLAQLRDMADGYSRLETTGAVEMVGADQETARKAAETLTRLTATVREDGVSVIALPYAYPDLSVLAAQGWRDGLEQLQLGKQELVETLGLDTPPAGAYSAGFKMSSACIGVLAGASIEYVVADGALASQLADPLPPGTVFVRARNETHDRVTLVLAEEDLRPAVGPPWDASLFFARLAAKLASGGADIMVIVPATDLEVPPQGFLDALGKELAASPWIATVTVDDAVRSHPPDARPSLLEAQGEVALRYVGSSLLAAVDSAHAAIAGLASIADPTRTPLDTARRFLYVAESRWWYREEVSLEEASEGLRYALRAEEVARSELAKLSIEGVTPSLVWGRHGQIRLTFENRTGYPVRVELELTGDGLDLASTRGETVQMGPGSTEIVVELSSTRSAADLKVRLMAGPEVIAQKQARLRFIILGDIVPWVVVGFVVLAGIAAVTSLALRRRGRPTG